MSASPPLKKAISADTFRSPNRNELKEALRSGGIANVDAQTGEFEISSILFDVLIPLQVYDLQNESIQLYWIATRPMSEILENINYRSFTLHTVDSTTGQLTVDTSSANLIGRGGFKLPILGG